MKKRVISVLLTAVLLIGLLPAMSFSADSTTTSDLTCYRDVVQAVIDKRIQNSGCGMFYDLNGDGVKELFLLYEALHEEKNFPYAYASVYTQRNGKAVPIAEDVCLSAEAGGPMDEVGILEEEGKLYACAHWENGESWGVPTRSWGGEWYLYQISGAEGELAAYVDFSGDLSSETGLFVSGDFTRNGLPMSTDDYNQWRQSIRWISCIHTPYYSIAAESNYRVKTLSELLNICNGSPDTGCNGGDACPGKDFVDMPATTNWAHDGIDFALSEGLFLGTDAKHFSPNGTMTRGMLVTVLWRLDGKPTVTGATRSLT
ncbi:MAG: S-layer homology domain-containing protein [Faecousia sp.]